MSEGLHQVAAAIVRWDAAKAVVARMFAAGVRLRDDRKSGWQDFVECFPEFNTPANENLFEYAFSLGFIANEEYWKQRWEKCRTQSS